MQRHRCLNKGPIDVGGNCHSKLQVTAELAGGDMGSHCICHMGNREGGAQSGAITVFGLLCSYKPFPMDTVNFIILSVLGVTAVLANIY